MNDTEPVIEIFWGKYPPPPARVMIKQSIMSPVRHITALDPNYFFVELLSTCFDNTFEDIGWTKHQLRLKVFRFVRIADCLLPSENP